MGIYAGLAVFLYVEDKGFPLPTREGFPYHVENR